MRRNASSLHHETRNRSSRLRDGCKWALVCLAAVLMVQALALEDSDRLPPSALVAGAGARDLRNTDQVVTLYRRASELEQWIGTADSQMHFDWKDLPVIPCASNTASPIIAASGCFSHAAMEQIVVCHYTNDRKLRVSILGNEGQMTQDTVFQINGPGSFPVRDLDLVAVDLIPSQDSDDRQDEIIVVARDGEDARVFLLSAELEQLATYSCGPIETKSDLAVSAGDFSADGRIEIVLGYVPKDGSRRLMARLLQVSPSGAESRALVPAGDPVCLYTFAAATWSVLHFDIASGAFSAPGAAELGYAAGRAGYGAGCGGAALGFATFGEDVETAEVTRSALDVPARGDSSPGKTQACDITTFGIRADAAALRFDPDHGYPAGRQQLVAVGTGFAKETEDTRDLVCVSYVLVGELNTPQRDAVVHPTVLTPCERVPFGQASCFVGTYLSYITVGRYAEASGTARLDQVFAATEWMLRRTDKPDEDHNVVLQPLTFDESFHALENEKEQHRWQTPGIGVAIASANMEGESLCLDDPRRITFLGDTEPRLLDL